MNAKADIELRNLFPGKAPEGVPCCSICGKPEARADKVVKELTHHKAAIDEDLPGKFRNLTRALGNMTQDFIDRVKFNAQLESIRQKLVNAREEHDAYVPAKPVKPIKARGTSDKAMLIDTLTQTLHMLGVTEIEPNPNPASDGEWSALALADALQHRIGEMLAEKESAATQTGE